MASGSQKHGFAESRFEKAVNPNFLCSVCLNVVKDPKMCRNNEHIFCSDCITEHLEHSSTCPECTDPLTVETLKRPPKLLLNCLSELNIKCDHHSRGCRQYVRLVELSSHAMKCDFAPVRCSNQGCGMEINKRDRIYHETQVCEYRQKCHECTEIRREMDKMKINMAEVRRGVVELNTNLARVKTDMAEHKAEMVESGSKANADITKMKTDLAEMRIDMEEMKTSIAEMKTDMAESQGKVMSSLAEVKEELLKEFRATTSKVLRKLNTTQLPPHVEPAAEEEDIVIAGGRKNLRDCLSSVERFTWQTKSWASLPPMKEPRSGATSFVYKNQIFAAGGRTSAGATDRLEMMNIQGELVQWETFPAKMPIKVYDHKTVVYQDRLIVLGGYDETHRKWSDAIYEVLLTSPYCTKLLHEMPELIKHSYGTELINNKVYFLGGWSSNGVTDSVVKYDVVKNKCKQMPPLPYAVWDMSTVSWRDKVILLGGRDKKRKCLNDVLMYDTVTGKTEVLPSMKHKRRGSSAVATADKMVIMGGENDYGAALTSVECYNFSSNSWEELPPMVNHRRDAWAAAVVKSVS